MRGKGLSPCFRPKARSPDSTLPLCFKDNAKIRNPESATHGFSRFLTFSNGFSPILTVSYVSFSYGSPK